LIWLVAPIQESRYYLKISLRIVVQKFIVPRMNHPLNRILLAIPHRTGESKPVVLVPFNGAKSTKSEVAHTGCEIPKLRPWSNSASSAQSPKKT
jgi:hypothetical protein